VVEFDATHSVVLLCTPDEQRTASDLAESLLALGFEAFVVHDDLDGLEPLQGDRPALFVPMSASFDTPAFRARVRGALGRDPEWTNGEIAKETFVLLRRIQSRLDELERARTQELPIDSGDEDLDGAVVPLVRSAPPEASRPAPRRQSLPVVIWPAVGATLTALGMALVLPDRTPPAVETVETMQAPTPAAVAIAEPVAPVPAAAAPTHTRKRAEVPPPPEPTIATEPEAAGIAVEDNDRVTVADDYLVFTAPDRPRDWYAAMNLCRGRAHAGLEGWTTPSSRQLHALAAARALPEAPLWSRTRSAHSKDVAFVVHGKVGNVRSTEKSETLSAAVCVRKRHEGPDGD